MEPGRRKPDQQACGQDSKKTRFAPHLINVLNRESAMPGGKGQG